MAEPSVPGDEVAANSAQAGLAVPALVLADGLSYEEYFKQINKMADHLRAKWQREEKVGALKVAIQLSKLLADTGQLKLYAKKYARVVEIVDEFGACIYERIHALAEGREGAREPQLANRNQGDPRALAADCLELAKDIYRNWQLKILSIRELVPRFYTELAILGASDILHVAPTSKSRQASARGRQQSFQQALTRLGNYCAGLGDPIVSLHARAYLCKVAERLLVCNGGGGGGGGTNGESILVNLVALNLQSAAVAVCRLDVAQISRSDASLHFDLLSNALHSILNIMTARYGADGDDDDDDDDERLERHDDRRAQLFDLAESVLAILTKEEPCGFQRNVILNGLFTSLPSDISAPLAGRLMAELRVGHDRWLSLGADTRAKGVQVTTIYATLASFLTALDGSEAAFGAVEQRPARELSGRTCAPTGASVVLLAETMVADVLAHEHARGGGRLSNSYLKCFKALLTFASHHAPAILDRPLGTLSVHMRRGRQYMEHSAHLIDIIKGLFTQQRVGLEEIRGLVASRPFNQLFDCLRKDEHRMDVARYVLEMLRSNVKLSQLKGTARGRPDGFGADLGPAAAAAATTTTTTTTTTTRDKRRYKLRDRAIINFLLKLFDTVNNSLSPLAAGEDLRHLAEIVIFFINLVDFDADPFEMLEFYTRCRASLANLNATLEFLVDRVLLVGEAHGRGEKRRSVRQNVLNCCLAFAFTTLPAVRDRHARLERYVRACQLALASRSLSLADYLMRQIMASLQSLVESRDAAAAASDLTEPKPKPTDRRDLNKTLGQLLETTIEHQEHIDLKHKFALSKLIRTWFSECPNLLLTLNRLNCVDDSRATTEGYDVDTARESVAVANNTEE